MTRLVVDPLRLQELFSNGSVSNPERIRMIAQVVEYLDFDSMIMVKMIPTLPDATKDGVLINVGNIVEYLNKDVTMAGTIVSIEGFYDGITVTAFDCYAINGEALLESNSTNTMLKMTKLDNIS